MCVCVCGRSHASCAADRRDTLSSWSPGAGGGLRRHRVVDTGFAEGERHVPRHPWHTGGARRAGETRPPASPLESERQRPRSFSGVGVTLCLTLLPLTVGRARVREGTLCDRRLPVLSAGPAVNSHDRVLSAAGDERSSTRTGFPLPPDSGTEAKPILSHPCLKFFKHSLAAVG